MRSKFINLRTVLYHLAKQSLFRKFHNDPLVIDDNDGLLFRDDGGFLMTSERMRNELQ